MPCCYFRQGMLLNLPKALGIFFKLDLRHIQPTVSLIPPKESLSYTVRGNHSMPRLPILAF